MTKSNIALIPAEFYCPDRWQYSFDGQKLTMSEEFDEMPEQYWETTINLMGQMGFEVNREGNTISVVTQATQEEAVASGLREFALQAVIQGLISLELQPAIYESLKTKGGHK